MKNLILSVSSLLKFNKGFFKSEKQAQFLLKMSGGEIVNHFTTYGNVARDHYFLDDKGVFLIERYTDKKGYVKTWERGQVHKLESKLCTEQKIKSEREKAQIQNLGYTIDCKDFYAFCDLFESIINDKNRLNFIIELSEKGLDSEIIDFIDQYKQLKESYKVFKSVYFSCNP